MRKVLSLEDAIHRQYAYVRTAARSNARNDLDFSVVIDIARRQRQSCLHIRRIGVKFGYPCVARGVEHPHQRRA